MYPGEHILRLGVQPSGHVPVVCAGERVQAGRLPGEALRSSLLGTGSFSVWFEQKAEAATTVLLWARCQILC